MPTVISHSFVGIASATAISKKGMLKRVWPLSVVCTVLPDLDVIGFYLGIPYAHIFGHRGFFHSPVFAVLLGFLAVLLFFGKTGFYSRLLYWVYFSWLTASHGVLDAFTNGGLGVALLSPFTNKRFFFEFTPIAVAPLSPKYFLSDRTFNIIVNEMLWVWAPMCLICLVIRGWRAYQQDKKSRPFR